MIDARLWAKRGIALIVADDHIVAAWQWPAPGTSWPIGETKTWWSEGYPRDYTGKGNAHAHAGTRGSIKQGT